MSASTHLHGLAYTLGAKETVDTLEPLREDEQLLRQVHDVGLRYYHRSDSTPIDLAAEVITQTIAQSPITADEVDVLIFASASVAGGAFDAARVMSMLDNTGLTRATPIGISLSDCGNFGSAMRAAHSLIMGSGARNVLVVTSDVCRDPRSRILTDTLSILSDGAASCLLSAEHPSRLELLATAGRTNQKVRTADLSDMSLLIRRGLVKVVSDLLRRSDAELADVGKLMANNVNAEAVRFMTVALGLGPDRAYLENVADFGHVHSADILINLLTYLEEGAAPDELIVTISHSYGTWGAATFRVAE
ncbi:3-oxoacyl-[acyl-carrier-protein] synthase III C-terminal domain-containing protein [Mycobacterium attenuatum]|uniref:3-oxoacyl-[acyl-carrier-protein] synthase III C-terminal domain-containing protein n=1 Tax=Mycobacterium attenuatum TaxID=2341086 RepID=UPI000F02C739|nr:3-oxoacyl-[acyl-carrier-protein] synthase III C-terminal domain-containing protein [Mycobacterium attenuatum]VBA62413.1 3-oxoacyl-[acyl-carrier-protein] synthase 3 [Mycobacterium attenuatum]